FCIFVLLLLVFRIVGSVRLRETIEGLRLRYAITNRTKEETRDFEAAELHLRRAKTFDEWWRAVSTAAEMMDFLDISLPLTNRDGTSRTLTWRKNGSEQDSQNHIGVNIPIHDRRLGPPLNLKIEAYADGSLESAGRRIALFTRLVEEHDVAALKDVVSG
ncbi:MAG: hypothetical protein ISS76_20880, partial [Phycisphaerae bacterium]|nr:hypothetical protein [Phycisphaerae bacterium]